MQQNTPIPQQLQYQSIRPVGWHSKFKQWTVNPLSSNAYWTSSQIVRFVFQLTYGLMDPYRSHLQITVDAPQPMPVGSLQIDNSAQSFISQVVISSNNVQIQRIPQYDTLAAYLTDIGFSQTVCKNRQWEGLGYCGIQNVPFTSKTGYTTNNYYLQQKTDNSLVQMIEQNPWLGRTSVTKVPTWGIGNTCPTDDFNAFTNVGQQSGSSTLHHTSSNWLNIPKNLLPGTPVDLLGQLGRMLNVRAQYMPGSCLHQYPDSANGNSPSDPVVANGVVPTNFTTGATMPAGKQYSVGWATGGIMNKYQQGVLLGSPQQPTTNNLIGFTRPYSSHFAQGAFQPAISATVPFAGMSYGQLLDNNSLPTPQRTFKIPLLSGILGVLIPADQFCLIPLKALNNLLIQLTLNPYAMFSSGYSDVHEFDTTGMGIPIKRNFQISRIIYNLHIYEFPDEQLQAVIKTSLSKQITITSNTWAMAYQKQIPDGQQVKNNFSVNVNCQSLAQIVCLFLSNQYLKYPFCRKQFRLSNNITSMQIKFNTDYYPPQPITGNAGNPVTVDNTGNNANFLQLLLTSNNYLFVTNTPQPRINTYNFAINGRCYNPANTSSLYDPASYANPTYTWTTSSVNGDTAMGMSNFHENRYIGKAAFVMSFQPYGHSHAYMCGVDTRNVRPFQVIFDAATKNYFPTDQTLYIFARQNLVVAYGENGIQVYGR